MSRKIDYQNFVSQSSNKFNFKFIYPEEVKDFNFKYKEIEVICPLHGKSWQKPIIHLNSKCGCTLCSFENRSSETKNSSWNKLVILYNERHKNKYDYSQSKYFGINKNISINCPIHGKFEMLASSHKKFGCPHCLQQSSFYRNKEYKDKFIQRAKQIHGDTYCYLKSNVISAKEKVEIVCRNHGSFFQQAYNHLKGHGCPSCYGRKIDKNDLITDIKAFYGEDVDINSVPKELSSTSSIIINGKSIAIKTFRSQETNRIRSQTHFYKIKSKFRSRIRGLVNKKILKVSCDNSSKLSILNCDIDNFIKYLISDGLNKGIDIQNSDNSDWELDHIYPCSKFDLNSQEDLNICFNYRNYQILNRSDNISKNDSILEEFALHKQKISNILEIEKTIRKQTEINSCKFVGDDLFVDIYHPLTSTAIKFYSLLQAKEEILIKDKVTAKNNGIKLIQFFDDDLILKFDIVKSMISSLLNIINNKIYARKCVIKEISKKEKNLFLKENHIQGNDRSVVEIGLFHLEKLVSIMTFCKSRVALGGQRCDFELSRYCSLKNTVVTGAFSKIYSFFKKTYKPKTVISYCDLSRSDGNIYINNGFKLMHQSRPNYFYFEKRNLLKKMHRFNFIKSNLSKKLKIFDLNLTEAQNCANNGLLRAYNAGNLLFKDDGNC